MEDLQGWNTNKRVPPGHEILVEHPEPFTFLHACTPQLFGRNQLAHVDKLKYPRSTHLKVHSYTVHSSTSAVTCTRAFEANEEQCWRESDFSSSTNHMLTLLALLALSHSSFTLYATLRRFVFTSFADGSRHHSDTYGGFDPPSGMFVVFACLRVSTYRCKFGSSG